MSAISTLSAYSTYNVLALVRLVRIALDSLSTAVLALDDVLVRALLVEVGKLGLCVFTSSALPCPCSLDGLALHLDKINKHTSFASIIRDMTSPLAYCSLLKLAEARGRVKAAIDAHFILTR
jgi:hypothetical protein